MAKWLQIPKGGDKYVKGEEGRAFKQLQSCFIRRADATSCLVRKLNLSELISFVLCSEKDCTSEIQQLANEAL